MRKLLIITASTVLFTSMPVLAQDTYVRGYIRSDGAYVQPHYRTEQNESASDNYSTKGNVNPYTGRPGYITPEENNSGYQGYQGYQSQQPNYDGQYNGQYNGGFGQDNRKKRNQRSLFDND